MKVKRIKFNTDYYENGEVKYAKGEHYPKTDEAFSQALAGHAQEIEMEMESLAAEESAEIVKAASIARARRDAENSAKATAKTVQQK